jgi:predicted GNAT family acetyltransferase
MASVSNQLDPTVICLLTRGARTEALSYLRRDSHNNLFLIDLAAQVGRRALPGEPRPRLLVARRGDEIVGIASLRPTVVLDTSLSAETLRAFLPQLTSLRSGLVRSSSATVEPLWEELTKRGRRALVDRTETAFLLRRGSARLAPTPSGLHLREARSADLDALVEAARASLREEGRPDPFHGDPGGFRHWVRARLPRALVVEHERRIVFVGYADVRRSEGWLLQGVYTWPDWRRRGLATAGVLALCRAAFELEAEHVQLSVVDGNEGAVRLYERLGFRSFALLRTLLFA